MGRGLWREEETVRAEETGVGSSFRVTIISPAWTAICNTPQLQIRVDPKQRARSGPGNEADSSCTAWLWVSEQEYEQVKSEAEQHRWEDIHSIIFFTHLEPKWCVEPVLAHMGQRQGAHPEHAPFTLTFKPKKQWRVSSGPRLDCGRKLQTWIKTEKPY